MKVKIPFKVYLMGLVSVTNMRLHIKSEWTLY